MAKGIRILETRREESRLTKIKPHLVRSKTVEKLSVKAFVGKNIEPAKTIPLGRPALIWSMVPADCVGSQGFSNVWKMLLGTKAFATF